VTLNPISKGVPEAIVVSVVFVVPFIFTEQLEGLSSVTDKLIIALYPSVAVTNFT